MLAAVFGKMETKFISITEKAALMVALQLGEKDAIQTVMDELNRLESVIKDYEIGIRQINDKFNSKTFKRPSNSR
jgi:archaellum component FlaC